MQGAGDAANNAHVPAGEADLAPAHSASCFPGQIAGDRASQGAFTRIFPRYERGTG